jgi:hypothetical protein
MVSLQDDVRDGLLRVRHVSSEHQLADVFTKPLPAAEAERCLVELGFRYWSRTAVVGEVLGPGTQGRKRDEKENNMANEIAVLETLEMIDSELENYRSGTNSDESSDFGFWIDVQHVGLQHHRLGDNLPHNLEMCKTSTDDNSTDSYLPKGHNKTARWYSYGDEEKFLSWVV